MKILHKAKDGGAESSVTGYWLVECKWLFSIAILRFDAGSRESYHTHAFNSISWVLWGELREVLMNGSTNYYTPSLKPVITFRDTFHRVFGVAPQTWVLTFRGPWVARWKEFLPRENRAIILTHGRKVVA